MGSGRKMITGIGIIMLVSTIMSLVISTLVVYLTSGDGRDLAKDLTYALSIGLIVPPLVSAPVAYYLLRQREQIRMISEELAYSLKYDSLTGLLTRRAFCQYVEERLVELDRTASPFAMFFIDLDHFKQVNDRFGHMIGDEVLRIFGRLINNCVEAGEVVGRMGGEEFCLFMEQCSVSEAEARGRQIAEAFRIQARYVHDRKVEATLSAGIIVTRRRTDLDFLLSRADELLYIAKENGRDRIIVGDDDYQPQDDRAVA